MDFSARIEQYLASHGLAPRVLQVLPLTGDASDRRYFRVLLKDDGSIVLALHAASIDFEGMSIVRVSRFRSLRQSRPR